MTATTNSTRTAMPLPELMIVLDALANPIRWEILSQVCESGLLHMSALRRRIGMSRHGIAHHLHTLSDAGLLTVRPGRAPSGHGYAAHLDTLSALASNLQALLDEPAVKNHSDLQASRDIRPA